MKRGIGGLFSIIVKTEETKMQNGLILCQK
jgi:hypothetical protein